MFKLVVLMAFITVAAAKPGYYGHLEHAAPVVAVHGDPAVVAAPIIEKYVAPVAVPAAVSHTYRKDIISEPVVASYGAHAVPVISKAVVAAPYAPYYGHSVAYGAGLHGLHGYGEGLHGLHGFGAGLHGLHGHHGYGYYGSHW